MSILRKSKKPAVSTPISPAELVPNLTSERNPAALAASTTAIALSIGSAFSNVQPPIDEGIVPGRDTAWKAVYSAARMAVEVSKESSDMFLPLKAVVGAVSILIRNYDVRVFVCELNAFLSYTRLPIPANIR